MTDAPGPVLPVSTAFPVKSVNPESRDSRRRRSPRKKPEQIPPDPESIEKESETVKGVDRYA